ncbi:MAG: TolC family protein, partial [Candidatus Binatia bacterium]
ADAKAVELEVVAEAERAYAELWRRHEELAVYERDRELAARFARVSEERYATGASPQVDVLRSHVEVTRLLNRVETAKLALLTAAARLNSILSQAPETVLGVPEEPPALTLPDEPKALVAAALERRPDLAALRARVGGAEAAIASARLGLRPDFELSVSRFQNTGARDGFGATAAVTLPFAWRAKYDAGIAEADAALAAARSRVRSLEDRIGRDVSEALFAARSASIRRDLFLDTHLPQSEQAMRSAASGYVAAAVDFTTLLETFRAVEMVHLEHAEASADLGCAVADLDRAVGGDLPEILAVGKPPAEYPQKEHR